MALIKTARLDRRIKILSKVATKNEWHEQVTTWLPKKTLWASVRQQYFRDYQETYGTTLQNSVNFIIRYDAGKFVTKEDHVEFQGHQFRIEDILEGSFDRDFTTLVCVRMED